MKSLILMQIDKELKAKGLQLSPKSKKVMSIFIIKDVKQYLQKRCKTYVSHIAVVVGCKKKGEGMRFGTAYIHKESGLPVVISNGIGSLFSIYTVKKNGRLQRCKQFDEYVLIASASRALEIYAAKPNCSFRKKEE